MFTRRQAIGHGGAGIALTGSGLGLPKLFEAKRPGRRLSPGVPSGLDGAAAMESLPGKKPLIKLAYRAPNYESPLEYFRTPITPNDEFFVRYHLSDIPEVDAKTYKIAVGGEGANGRLELTLDDLKNLPAYELVAVNQCSGNRRGLSNPHVAGVRMGLWRHGLRALERRPAQGHSRQGRSQKRGYRDRVQRRRRSGLSTRRRISSRACRSGRRSMKRR